MVAPNRHPPVAISSETGRNAKTRHVYTELDTRSDRDELSDEQRHGHRE
jgi:hypothetical protein